MQSVCINGLHFYEWNVSRCDETQKTVHHVIDTAQDKRRRGYKFQPLLIPLRR